MMMLLSESVDAAVVAVVAVAVEELLEVVGSSVLYPNSWGWVD